MTKQTIQIRIDQDLKQQFQAKANTQETSLSSLLIAWIKAYIAGSSNPVNAEEATTVNQDLAEKLASIEIKLEQLEQNQITLDSQQLKQLISEQTLEIISQFEDDFRQQQS